MSDCSTAMEPKERRTCGTCKHVNDVRLGCMFAANDSSYYMRSTRPGARACGHYVDDQDSLPRRHERLAQVAREMFHEYRELMKDYLWDNGASSSATKQRRLIVMFRDRLEECGVSVDGVG